MRGLVRAAGGGGRGGPGQGNIALLRLRCGDRLANEDGWSWQTGAVDDGAFFPLCFCATMLGALSYNWAAGE